MRLARLIIPGVFHHIISRFVDRDWYFNNDFERARYLDYFGRALAASDWKCLGYALMSNHIHHGVIPGDEPLEKLFKRTNSPFARWLNQTRGRLGPVFADRPASWAIRPEHVAATLAYIHNNPVRAGVVSDARHSSWTSYRAYVGEMLAPSWLAIDEGRAMMGVGVDELRAETARHVGPEAKAELARIHAAATKRGGVALATPTANPTHVPLVARPFARVRPDPREVITVVASLLAIEPERFASRSRDRECARARAIAVHAARALGLSGSDMASALGVTRQHASKLLARRLDALSEGCVRLTCERLTTFPPSLLRARRDTV